MKLLLSSIVLAAILIGCSAVNNHTFSGKYKSQNRGEGITVMGDNEAVFKGFDNPPGYGYLEYKSDGVKFHGLINLLLLVGVEEGMLERNGEKYVGDFSPKKNKRKKYLFVYNGIVKRENGKVEYITHYDRKANEFTDEFIVIQPDNIGSEFNRQDSIYIYSDKKCGYRQFSVIYNLRSKPRDPGNYWSMYQGFTNDSLPGGLGVMYYWDGKFFFGEFNKGKKTGNGIMFKNGVVTHVGYWENDVFIKEKHLVEESWRTYGCSYAADFRRRYIPKFDSERDYTDYESLLID